ncbi:methyl-accepting chemotaxis protein [Enterobacter cancerogenus]|uniref:methyl-accepting chemotaxis protein n=1 Tax=Enterobacter cancerogenus TaxID=69218 RepID=UPI003075DF75
MSHSASKISDITSVIDGIAFQTNILALNTAVEAARAAIRGVGLLSWLAECETFLNAAPKQPERSKI